MLSKYLLFSLLAAAAFAQQADSKPDQKAFLNAAPFRGMKLRLPHSRALAPVQANSRTLQQPNTGACSIPLKTYKPDVAKYHMRSFPAPSAIDPKIVVPPPAPPCNETDGGVISRWLGQKEGEPGKPGLGPERDR